MYGVETAVYGNRRGSHQLLDSSFSVHDVVLDTLRFLVDRPAGHVGSEVQWSPYWGCQKIDGWWALWRGEEDFSAPRKNMVIARVALVPEDLCGGIGDLDGILALVGAGPSDNSVPVRRLAGSVANCIATQIGPAIVVGVHLAPLVLAVLWARLWPTARATLSLRTFFGVESVESVSASSIVVIPHELRHRWHSHRLIGSSDAAGDELSVRWFTGDISPLEERVFENNRKTLPGEFSILQRVERMGGCLERLQAGDGTLADALLIIRTQEAIPNGFDLPSVDQQIIDRALHRFEDASIEEVRSASLTAMDTISDLQPVEEALTRWVQSFLPAEETDDALWILEHHLNNTHALWWRQAIARGMNNACLAKTVAWAKAIWRWWEALPKSIPLTMRYLSISRDTEQWLTSYTPSDVNDAVINELAPMCGKRNWATLLARALGSSRPLLSCIRALRHNVPHPETGLHTLLLARDPKEIVAAALGTPWQPLLAAALSYTVENPRLLIGKSDSAGFLGVFTPHLSQGGQFPPGLLTPSFIYKTLNGALQEHPDYLIIIKHLNEPAAPYVLDHPECERLLSLVTTGLFHATAEEWWRRFLSTSHPGRPPRTLWPTVANSANRHLDAVHVALFVEYLRFAPEIDEENFACWTNDHGFRWESSDYKEMAKLLLERTWTNATRMFRWSWKRELNIVAWYARDLLTGIDQFWTRPEGISGTKTQDTKHENMRRNIVVSFLAANPANTTLLSLDEEVRDIVDNIRRSKHRDSIEIRTRWAVRPNDLQQILLEDQPTVVHFSGHGTDNAELVLHSSQENDNTLISTNALSDLFRALQDDIRVVIINACYSEPQAQAIVSEIDFVVGMAAPIRDDSARSFAAAFYRALAFGRSVNKAFELGTNAIDLEGNKDATVPRLYVRVGANATTTHLLPRHRD